MADATPTYRGFRKQFLYILWRILCDDNNDNLVYQPEKIEDLAVFERMPGRHQNEFANQALIIKELIQVKDHSDPLIFSDFNPHSKDSFFHRITKELKHRDINISIASYGEFGTELKQAFNGVKTLSVTQKLSGLGIKDDIASKIVQQTNAVIIEENNLEAEIISKLSEGPASPDPENTFDLLIKWVYDCCEKSQLIQKKDVQTKINSIGTYISERENHSSEWGVALASLQEQLNHEYDKTKLVNEYLEGMDASLLHIHVGCDVVRNNLLNEINEKISNSNIVIIHGASGQGKSTLAYRYIYDYYPMSLCYEVKNISDSQHALRIARAISGYSKGCGEILLYIDIKPGWSGWETLLADLRHCNNIKVLVTIREEELHIANFSSEFSYKGILLEFTEDEAEEIYQTIPSHQISDEISSFEEAWQRFGETGPLLEFVHLVTHGGKLEERIRAQIDRIHDGIISGKRSSTEIDILRLVSVASAFGASCNSYELMKYLGIDSSRFFHKLQDEYLIKKDGDSITGLHSIRSEKILTLMCDNQQLVAEAVCECIPLIIPDELHIFLLYAFTRCPKSIGSIIDTINSVKIQTWAMAQNILDALLWLGVKKYVEENSALLSDVYKKFKISPAFCIDCYVSDKNQTKNSMFELLKDQLPKEGVEEMQSFINRQTDKSRILLYCKVWLNKASFIISDTSSKDFSSIGKLCFWAAKVEEKIPVDQKTIDLFIKDISTIRTTIAADFIVGLYYFDKKFFNQVTMHRNEIIHQFKKETYTLKFEETKDSVSIYYLVPLQVIDGYDSIVTDKSQEASLNDESVFRIKVLRKIYPDKKEFIAKGFGQNIMNVECAEYYHDDTVKKMSIDILYLDWEVNINAIFCNLSYLKFREKTWKDYVDLIMKQRKIILDTMNLMCEIAGENLRNINFNAWLQQKIKGNEIKFLDKKVEQYPIPQCSVGEWGFFGESNVDSKVTNHMTTDVEQFYSTYKEYARTWEHVTNQFMSGMYFSAASKLLQIEEITSLIEEHSHQANLCLHNLMDFIKNLSSFQKNLNGLFKTRFSLNELENIEADETKAAMRLLGLLNVSINTPCRKITNPINYVSNIDSLFGDLIKKMKKLLKKKSNSSFSFNLLDSTESNQLWLSIESNDLELFDKGLFLLKESINDFLKDLSPLNKILLEINFSHINIVSLYKGKLLFDTYLSYFLLSIFQEGFNSLDDKTRSFPFDIKVKKKLNITSHNTLEKSIALRFGEYNEFFYTFLTHLNDINKLGECDDDMGEFCETYIKQLLSSNNPLQSLFDNAAEVFEICNGFDEDEMLENPLKYQAMTSILNWHKTGIKPFWHTDGGVHSKEFNLNMMSEWAKTYHSAFELGATAVLCFTAASVE